MSNATILIIDPSPETRSMYGDYFRYHGYTVMEAADGSQGMRLSSMRAPDLVVTEISDEPAWLQAIQMLRRRGDGAGTATILCSTRLDPVRPYVPSHLDADIALAKPTSPHRLLVEVQQLLERRSGRPRPFGEVA